MVRKVKWMSPKNRKKSQLAKGSGQKTTSTVADTPVTTSLKKATPLLQNKGFRNVRWILMKLRKASLQKNLRKMTAREIKKEQLERARRDMLKCPGKSLNVTWL